MIADPIGFTEAARVAVCHIDDALSAGGDGGDPATYDRLAACLASYRAGAPVVRPPIETPRIALRAGAAYQVADRMRLVLGRRSFGDATGPCFALPFAVLPVLAESMSALLGAESRNHDV